MPTTDDYLGEFVTVTTLTVVTPGDSPVTALIQGIVDFKPPGRKFMKTNYTWLSGTNAGKQQVLLTSQEAATIEITAIYEKVHAAAIDAVAGINGCTVTLVTSDGATWAGIGSISESTPQNQTDNKVQELKQVIELNAGWTYTPGS